MSIRRKLFYRAYRKALRSIIADQLPYDFSSIYRYLYFQMTWAGFYFIQFSYVPKKNVIRSIWKTRKSLERYLNTEDTVWDTVQKEYKQDNGKFYDPIADQTEREWIRWVAYGFAGRLRVANKVNKHLFFEDLENNIEEWAD